MAWFITRVDGDWGRNCAHYRIICSNTGVLLWLAFQNDLAKRFLRSDLSVWSYSARLGGIIAFVRISIYWYLIYREWTATQSLSLVPRILVLLPERAMPRDWPLPVAHALLLSGLLAIGSFGFGLLASLLMRTSLFRGKQSN